MYGYSMSEFRTNKPSYYVIGPNGDRMVARPVVRNIPANLKNINKRQWTTNTSVMLNKIRQNGWSHVKRDDIIKFIMYAYYGAFALKNNDDEVRRQVHNFHYAYSKISTRDPRNRIMISPAVLWRHLQPLTKAYLVFLAKIVEW